MHRRVDFRSLERVGATVELHLQVPGDVFLAGRSRSSCNRTAPLSRSSDAIMRPPAELLVHGRSGKPDGWLQLLASMDFANSTVRAMSSGPSWSMPRTMLQ